MSATLQNVFKSKWGYHPCNYETFLKLKALNKVYQQALRQKASWERWERKEPHNRVARRKIRDSSGHVVGYMAPEPVPEPALNGLLEKQTYSTWQDRRGNYLKKPVECEKVVFKEVAHQIVEDYAAARRPVAGPEGVGFLNLSEERINQLYLFFGGESPYIVDATPTSGTSEASDQSGCSPLG